jgi:hypothetical protein
MVCSEPKADQEYSPLPGRKRGVYPEWLAAQAANEAQPVALAGKRPDRDAGEN